MTVAVTVTVTMWQRVLCEIIEIILASDIVTATCEWGSCRQRVVLVLVVVVLLLLLLLLVMVLVHCRNWTTTHHTRRVRGRCW